MNISWIKISTAIFDDEKIKLIESMTGGSDILLLWFKLLALAGRNNLGGCVCLNENVPYTSGMLSTLFNKQQNIINSALKTFKDFQMIEVDSRGFIFILNWEKHQSEDKLLKIREQTRERVQRHRLNQKQRLLSNGCNVTIDGMEQKPGFSVESHKNSEDDQKAETANLEQNQKDVTLQPALRNAIELDIEYNIYIQVFDYWNEQEIIKHRKFTDSIKSKIKSKLKDYSLEEIKASINNYSIILKGNEYYFNYKWTLDEFLKRGFEKFFNLDVAKNNYSKKEIKINHPQNNFITPTINKQFTSESNRMLL